ncbi:hypothetical protein BDM02DRAFT_3188442 [Thelephora ganbajun]|uniref:Uncharacterized protein n=1 Tax=Thelephora ganbajun TaxID=370292 RepID=A0ACB6ZCM7_THEGA|nr:hypothetical protein BDM02DRAFT_3188442 [Thelephora ganbajun]
MYNNCSGNLPFFEPQIHINPPGINKDGTGREEGFSLMHNRLADGLELTYSYKWALGDQTSANVLHHAFVARTYFPNGTLYRQVVHDVFRYDEHADGDFTYSVANNHLT